MIFFVWLIRCCMTGFASVLFFAPKFQMSTLIFSNLLIALTFFQHFSPATRRGYWISFHSHKRNCTVLYMTGKNQKSRQWDCGYLECDEKSNKIVDISLSFGQLENRSARALESLSSFLGNNPYYLFHSWEILDHHLNHIKDSIGASNASDVLSVMNSRKKGLECT